jgi:hypothetical protein|tara:strand:- start:1646 stop:1918 length:273 start_codon:yes stop_codon:yes gene_type:complete
MKQFKFRMVVTYEYDFNIEAQDKNHALELCDEFQNIDEFICDTDARAMKFWDCSRDYIFIEEDKNPSEYGDVYTNDDLNDYIKHLPNYAK